LEPHDWKESNTVEIITNCLAELQAAQTERLKWPPIKVKGHSKGVYYCKLLVEEPGWKEIAGN
jgi:hypothetical protein